MNASTQNPSDHLPGLDPYESLVNSIFRDVPAFNTTKKYRINPTVSGINLGDLPGILDALKRDDRLTGLDFQIKEYEGIPHLRISWEHILLEPSQGRYRGNFGANRPDCTWVGSPMSTTGVSFLVNTKVLDALEGRS